MIARILTAVFLFSQFAFHNAVADHARMPDLEPAGITKQLYFHQHWMTGCSADPLFGGDRCKTQAFDFGDDPADPRHILQMTRGADGPAVHFYARDHAIDPVRSIWLTFDDGASKRVARRFEDLEPAGFHEGYMLLKTGADDWVSAFRRYNAVTVRYRDMSGATRHVRFSLTGFSAAWRELEKQEQRLARRYNRHFAAFGGHWKDAEGLGIRVARDRIAYTWNRGALETPHQPEQGLSRYSSVIPASIRQGAMAMMWDGRPAVFARRLSSGLLLILEEPGKLVATEQIGGVWQPESRWLVRKD